MMLGVSIVAGIPSGSIYSVSFSRVLDNSHEIKKHNENQLNISRSGVIENEDISKIITENERELAINWLLIAMDFGSFLA